MLVYAVKIECSNHWSLHCNSVMNSCIVMEFEFCFMFAICFYRLVNKNIAHVLERCVKVNIAMLYLLRERSIFVI